MTGCDGGCDVVDLGLNIGAGSAPTTNPLIVQSVENHHFVMVGIVGGDREPVEAAESVLRRQIPPRRCRGEHMSCRFHPGSDRTHGNRSRR